MREGNVTQWRRMFKDGSAICREWWSCYSVDKKCAKDGSSQFQKFRMNFHKFQGMFSLRLSQLGYAVTSFPHGAFRKCSRVHPRSSEWLQDSTFLKRYHKDRDEYLNHIVWITGDETWFSSVNTETNEQSKQWMNTHSLNKPKKFKKRWLQESW
jgi:hypothetical protein